MKRYQNLPVRRISPADGNYFFGYYDLPAFSADNRLHLTHKPAFIDRLQNAQDSVEFGLIDLSDGKYRALDTTCAWNFQQGAMLQWNPANAAEEIIYNSVSADGYIGVVQNIHTGKKRFLEKPVANVSRDGKYALSINFARLYNFRPGYGYAYYEDPFYYKNHSEQDGVFLIDMETGKAKLVLSMQQIWEFSGSFFSEDQKMCINHITFNPDASRFLFLARNFPPAGKPHSTALITVNRDGSDPYLLSDYAYASHYYWKDNEHLIFHAACKELPCSRGFYNSYLMRDQTHEGELVDPRFYLCDNHMSYSPDGKTILSDTYPDHNRMQQLNLYNTETRTGTFLGNFYSMEPACGDIRCDLHPRWNRTGTAFSFDSTHEGFRGVYLVDLEEYFATQP